ncbi:MAG: hypothetical protein RR444_10335, partial [Oscillospiraceae bacterium]
DLYQNAMNVKRVGYLNIINKLINDKNTPADQYLNPLIKKVRVDKNLYLNNPYINQKKKLGVLLLVLGKPFYKTIFNIINKGN